jgi:hypothetical protein
MGALPWQIVHTPGAAVEVRAPRSGADGPLPKAARRAETRLRYVYAGAPKPYVHPLATPAGHPLTNFEPHDHVWQRGLWFAIKFVNGENFWEENAPFGTQETEAYPEALVTPEGAFLLRAMLRWRRPGGDEALRERRTIAWRAREDACQIDWQTELTAMGQTLLDRTPYTTWGGYGGLTFRGTRGLDRTRFLTPKGERETMTGERAPWCDLSGRLDGGARLTAGVAFLDHPSNPRHPTPVYGHRPPVNFLNAAFLFHEPCLLAEHATLRLRYRVLVHDGVWEPDRLATEFERYEQE